jgi:hypothetical protein
VLSRIWRESTFDDIKEEATQTKLMGSNKDKITAAKAVCDKAVADWVYITMQSFNVSADSSSIEMIQSVNKFAPPGLRASASTSHSWHVADDGVRKIEGGGEGNVQRQRAQLRAGDHE